MQRKPVSACQHHHPATLRMFVVPIRPEEDPTPNHLPTIEDRVEVMSTFYRTGIRRLDLTCFAEFVEGGFSVEGGVCQLMTLPVVATTTPSPRLATTAPYSLPIFLVFYY